MSKDYPKGFNEGYVIAAHLPELAKDLSKIDVPTPRMEGFRDDRRQYVLDQTREQRPAWLRVERSPEQQQDRTQDMDRDREDRDVER